MNKVLAVDMGATSIRGVIGYIEDKKLITETVYRFKHDIIEEDGRKRWQWNKILKEIENIILENKDDISSIGVDTWGVDFGLLDSDGNLIENPMSYRDLLNDMGFEKSEEIISKKDLFLNTGNQLMSMNSLFQLFTYKLLNEEKFNKIDKILFMPDLVNYFLTSEKFTELTIASTSQMLDLNTNNWSNKVLQSFSIPKEILPDIIENKTIIGNIRNSKIDSLRETDIDIMSVASHDTASAVFLTKAYRDEEYAFLSSGTWSLIGGCTKKAYIDEEVFNSNLTNEIGFGSKNMFFKNITGLYLIERLRKEVLDLNGEKFDFDFISKLVLNTEPFKIYIDTDYKDFTNEEIPILESIEKYLVETNQNILTDKTEYFRGIYEGLVFKYYDVIKEIESHIGYEFKGIHIIGGGSKADFLCQMIADGLDKKVLAGPVEATAMGNILAQLSVLDENLDLDEIIKNSYNLVEYNPRNDIEWMKKYKMIKLKNM